MEPPPLPIRQPLRPLPRKTPGILATAALVVVLWGASEARAFLIPVAIAALLAFMLAPLIRALKKLHFPEWLAILTAALVLLLPLAAGIYAAVSQGQALIRDFPAISESLKTSLLRWAQSPAGRQLNAEQYLRLSVWVDKLGSSAGAGVQMLLGGLRALVSLGADLALVLLFTIIMLISRQDLLRSAVRFLSQYELIRAPELVREVTSLIERFLLARLGIAALVAVADSAILFGFGVHYNLLLGLILGILTVVPAVGFILSLIPVLVVCISLAMPFWQVLGVTAALTVVSAIESHVLSPRLLGRQLNVNLLATFLGAYAGGLLWGVWGMFLSIPILAILRIALCVSPRLSRWGELLAEKDDEALTGRLVRKRPAA